jgi:alpha-1,6-mannosyltransferase
MRLVVPGAQDGIEDVNPFARIYYVRAITSPVIDRRYRLILPHRFLVPAMSRVWAILKTEKPDLIEVCDKYSLCYLAGILRVTRSERPALVGLSCERMDDNVRAFVRNGPAAARFARWYMGEIYAPQFDAHIANSDYTAAELTPMNPRHPRPVFVRHMGVDTVTFTPDRANADRRLQRRTNLGIGPDEPLLLYSGRLSAEKHVPLLIEMLRELTLSDARLVIAGDGPLRDELMRRAAIDSPGRVHVLDTITDRGTLADWLTDVDLFVHPNPREPFGIGPLEAMAAGLPVVVPDRGGVRSYANDENAWLAAPTGRGLARAATHALARTGERARRRRRALETAAHHAWPATAARFFDLYREIASRHSRVYPAWRSERWLRTEVATREEVS